jgi:hypothetical protein
MDPQQAADLVDVARAMLDYGVRLAPASPARDAKLTELEAMGPGALYRFADQAIRRQSRPLIPTGAARQALAALRRADVLAGVITNGN